MDIISQRPKKPRFILEPEGGKHYIITFFQKEIGEVFYLPGYQNAPGAVLLFPYIKQIAEWDMEWKEIISKRKAIERKLAWSLELPFLMEDPGANETLTPEQRRERDLARDVIVVRKEPIWYLLHRENHPVIIPFSTTDGSDFVLVVSAVYEITNAIVAKTSVKNFLTFAEVAITANLSTVGRSMDFDAAQKIDQHVIKNHKVTIADPDKSISGATSQTLTSEEESTQSKRKPKKGEKIIAHLNRVKFFDKGFKLLDLEFVRVMVSPRSIDIQEAKEKAQKAEEEAKAFTFEQVAKNKMIVERGKATAKSMRAQLVELYEYKASVGKIEDQTQIKVAENYGKVNVLTLLGNSSTNRDDTKRIEEQIIGNTIQTATELELAEHPLNSQKKGGKHEKR